MKNLHRLFLLVAFGLTLGTVNAQNQNDQAMKAMMAYATPGDAQKMLGKSTGDWKADVTITMDPTAPAMKSTATVHNEMIMGGRYLATHFAGNMMGMPYEGMGTIGYDNGEKKYINTWIDNMGTGIMIMEGKMGDDGKSIEFKGKGYEPALGKEVMMRQVMTFHDENHHTMDMYMTAGDKEMKTMSIEMSR